VFASQDANPLRCAAASSALVDRATWMRRCRCPVDRSGEHQLTGIADAQVDCTVVEERGPSFVRDGFTDDQDPVAGATSQIVEHLRRGRYPLGDKKFRRDCMRADTIGDAAGVTGHKRNTGIG
jgi:hypothetical protein